MQGLICGRNIRFFQSFCFNQSGYSRQCGSQRYGSGSGYQKCLNHDPVRVILKSLDLESGPGFSMNTQIQNSSKIYSNY